MVRLALFGSPTVEFEGESFALPFERRHQLAAFLVLKRSWIARAELASLLWPEQPTKLAYTNLRKTLFRLQSLPWASRIETQGSALRLEVDCDVFAFESALRERRIDIALPLRRGELLAGFDDDSNEAWSSWLHFERERLRLAWRDAALERLAADIGAAEGIELSRRLLDADPLDEAALRAHLTWLARAGQNPRARAVYREFVRRLADDLGIAPSPQLQSLHDSLATAPASPTPIAPAAGDSDDSFIGRVVELRRIASLLAQDDCRLLSIVGPGGVGKTRLARRAMRQLAAGYADGAVFVALQDASLAELGGRIARELRIEPSGSADPLEQAIEFLRARQLLLVLDNFEELAADATMLTRILDACARLKILVTSRVRLAIAGEWTLRLDGLPCPEIEDYDHIETFDAVRLFVQAAKRVEPALVPGMEAAAIVDICRRVEGLPLALELAATWTRVLSCEAIADALREGTELLHTADNDQPTRHASMEVVFEHTWRLLSPIERDALARLSVFRGGFTAEAARAVAGIRLPVLGALVDKSLARKDGARLGLHPLVAQLAALRLSENEPRDATERAHALYFNRMLAQLRRGVEDGDRDALQSMDVELDNCRAAWRWSIAHDAGEALASGAPTLLHFCDHRSRLQEGLSLLTEALASAAASSDSRIAALLSACAAHLEYRLDRYPDAQASATRALSIAHDARDRDTRLQCFKVLGSCGLRLGRLDDAKRFFQQALALAPSTVDPHNAAAMLDNLALVEKMSGRYDEAMRLSIESLAQHRRLRDVAGEALCLNNLGALLLDRRELDSAGEHLRQGLAVCERHGLVSTRMLVLGNLAELAATTHDVDSADAYARQALDAAHHAGNRALACWLELLFTRIALQRSDWTAARAHVADALALAVALDRPSLKIAGVACFAELLDATGESASARRVLAFAADHPASSAAQAAEIRARLAQCAPTSDADPPETGLDLDQLAHRVIAERDIAHAPLIAALRGTH